MTGVGVALAVAVGAGTAVAVAAGLPAGGAGVAVAAWATVGRGGLVGDGVAVAAAPHPTDSTNNNVSGHTGHSFDIPGFQSDTSDLPTPVLGLPNCDRLSF